MFVALHTTLLDAARGSTNAQMERERDGTRAADEAETDVLVEVGAVLVSGEPAEVEVLFGGRDVDVVDATGGELSADDEVLACVPATGAVDVPLLLVPPPPHPDNARTAAQQQPANATRLSVPWRGGLAVRHG